MTTVQLPTSITPHELNRRRQEDGALELLDVRTPGEYASVHVPGTTLVPLDQLDAAAYLDRRGPGDKPIYLFCQSGDRACRAMEQFQRAGFRNCVLVEGGIEAWMNAGLPVQRGQRTVLPLMRQVQITIGIVSAIGAALALAVHPGFAVIPLLTGCGLLFAGFTGFCGLAFLLAKMPWNRAPGCAADPGGEGKH
jgi:rhodanese-related sulfurtransferase